MLQCRPGTLGIAGHVADLALLADKFGVLFGIRLDQGFTGIEQGLDFVVRSLLGEEEGEGGAEGSGCGWKGPVPYGNGLPECRLGLVGASEHRERVSQISELDGLGSLVADFPGDGESRIKVLEGLIDLTFCLVAISEISELDAFIAFDSELSGDVER